METTPKGALMLGATTAGVLSVLAGPGGKAKAAAKGVDAIAASKADLIESPRAGAFNSSGGRKRQAALSGAGLPELPMKRRRRARCFFGGQLGAADYAFGR